MYLSPLRQSVLTLNKYIFKKLFSAISFSKVRKVSLIRKWRAKYKLLNNYIDSYISFMRALARPPLRVENVRAKKVL